jgi:hypothetical protein
MTRQYPQAYESALLGVKSNSNSLKYAAAIADMEQQMKTVIYIISSYLAVDLVILLQIILFIQNLLNSTNTLSRNNAKTNESRDVTI